MFEEKVGQINISKSGKCLGLAYAAGTPAIYDMEGKNMIKCRPGHIDIVLSVFFSNDEKYFCSTGNDGYLKVFSIEGDDYLSPSLKFDCKISKDINRLHN